MRSKHQILLKIMLAHEGNTRSLVKGHGA